MVQSPLYALSELMEFAALSECQFLNMIEQVIEGDLCNFEAHMEYSMSNLKYHKLLLDGHSENSRRTWKSLKLAAATEESKRRSTPANFSRIVDDYEELSTRTEKLSKRCGEGIAMIANHAMLTESRKATSMTEGVSRLTVLGYIFLPLSLTTSFFGMNCREFGTGQLSIWTAFAVLVPLLIISGLFAYPQVPPLHWRSIFTSARN